jgi:putative DNA methylase
MAWDFAETNPFSNSTGNWMSMIDWEKRALIFLSPKFDATSSQIEASANLEQHVPSVLSTDPPYYDNISYADLSDFFYVWLRRNLSKIWPNEFATVLTPKAEELIANPYRAGSKVSAKEHFERGMEKVFTSAASSAESNFPAAIFYAFKATESDDSGIASTGWETFLEGLLGAGWAITATWPIRTEMQAKVGMNAGDNMLASSIVLACRKRSTTAPLATRSEFVAELRKAMLASVKILQQQNIAPVDLAQSAIGPGIAIFSRFSRVVEANGSDMTVRSALVLVNEALSEILSGEAAEFDADTRFALTWYEQFGFSDGLFGEADVLAKAKNTTVDNVVRAGVAQSKSGKVRLIPRGDLSEDWNPIEDRYLTVWEVAHHLIRSLEISEAEAAALLNLLGGGLSDRARQLAYLLYQISDRKKRADDSAAYNMLITAWPQLLKLAADAPDTTHDRLF